MDKVKKKLWLLILVLSIIFGFSLMSCSKENPRETKSITIKYDFSKGLDGWSGGFADLPVNYEKSIYELEFKHGDVPAVGKMIGGL